LIGQFRIGGRSVRVDLARGTSIVIPLDFVGPQPNYFGAPAAFAMPMAGGGFLGDTGRGGPCNVPVITLNPHCNGTHTESVSHIVDEAVPVGQVVDGRLIPASVVTVSPVPAQDSKEHYRPAATASDRLITCAGLRAQLADCAEVWLEAVVIRTRPNDAAKQRRKYEPTDPPPYLSIEAIDYLADRGVRHLVVDLPSVDKMLDEGRMTVHHRFWNVPEGSHSLVADSRIDCTITELTYVPDALTDGPYLLSLQVPAFCCDVAPSRPWLFPVEFD
jgi:kynurenine formamidase